MTLRVNHIGGMKSAIRTNAKIVIIRKIQMKFQIELES